MSEFHHFQARSLRGEPVELSRYAGQVALVVNTASKCGFTPQYGGGWSLYIASTPMRVSWCRAFPATSSAIRSPATPTPLKAVALSITA